jgi:hypothetical protein
MEVKEIQISYNNKDGFDQEHYPLEDWHRDAILRIHNLFELPIDVEWWYEATTHSRCFSCKVGSHTRLVAEEIKGLAEIKGFRWIEVKEINSYTKECNLSISLEHDQPA